MGVDMETSALFSVGKYLNMKVVSILIASDKHPLSENGKAWKWSMSMETRFSFFEKCIDFSLQTVSSTSEERVKMTEKLNADKMAIPYGPLHDQLLLSVKMTVIK